MKAKKPFEPATVAISLPASSGITFNPAHEAFVVGGVEITARDIETFARKASKIKHLKSPTSRGFSIQSSVSFTKSNTKQGRSPA